MVEGGGEGGGLVGRDEEAGLAVGDDFGDAADVGGDDGSAVGEGFQDAEAETFLLGGVNPEVAGGEVVVDAQDAFADGDSVGESEASNVGSVGGEVAAGEDEKLDVGAVFGAGDGFEDVGDAFAGTEVGEVEEEDFVVVDAEFGADFGG